MGQIRQDFTRKNKLNLTPVSVSASLQHFHAVQFETNVAADMAHSIRWAAISLKN